jgi:hypothetical protein
VWFPRWMKSICLADDWTSAPITVSFFVLGWWIIQLWTLDVYMVTLFCRGLWS